MLQIKTNSIKAAVTMAATKDVRYYLKGVEISVREVGGDVHVRATDGFIAFEDICPPVAGVAPCSIIIPLDVAKIVAKSKLHLVTLAPLTDGKWCIADTIFTPIDGRFPDCDRIFPNRNTALDTNVSHFDFELLARCQAAMRLALGGVKHYYRVQPGSVGLICREGEKFPRCAVQPLNLPKCFEGN